MDIIFKAGNDVVNVKIVGKEIYFKKVVNGIPSLQDLSNIKFPLDGIIKQFPDLKGLPETEIREKGSKRLKEHIKNMKTQDEIKNYVIKELEGIGCQWLSIVRPGFRPIVNNRTLESIKK
jgi:hypothetical protein